MNLREQFELEKQEKHLFDVVQIRPYPRWSYVEWLENKIEKLTSTNKDLAKSCGTCKVHNSLSRNKRCFDWPECGLTYDKWKPMNIAKS